ncbi:MULTISPECIES: hypothetical protein [Lysobacter]|uniref:hypothetical protein n=1 Tax=Lysobacter TaxID=68 RepID=UPI001F38D038|nr:MULTISPECIES: hypothetical protein [Lysobacter]UJB19489.1 hypothetical protein L1A79_24865 [Lysobacter capsici]UJQ26785.1 hypothetical protein L2D09_15020 [Lysobacter gummosus]
MLAASMAALPIQQAFAQPSPEVIITLDFEGYSDGFSLAAALDTATRRAELAAAQAGYSACILKGYTYQPPNAINSLYRAWATVTCSRDTTPPTPPPPVPPPTLYPPVRNGTDHTVSWSVPSGTHVVLEQAVSGRGWKERYKGSATSWTQRAAAVGNYEYRARVIGGSGSPYSAVVVIIVSDPPPTPTLPITSIQVGPNHAVTWNASAGADTYQLDRAGEDGVWSTVYLGPVTQWTAVDTKPGTYRYRVTACTNTACSAPSADSVFQVVADITPVITFIINQ